MKRSSDFATKGFRFAVMALSLALMIVPALAQEQSYNGGIVDDWTHHHVIFSNPGTLEDAMKKGTYQEWQRIVTEPRYRMQQARRYGPVAQGAMLDTARVPEATPETVRVPGAIPERIKGPGKPGPEPPNPPRNRWNSLALQKPLHTDWSVQILGGSGGPLYLNVYPAKYTFSPVGAPSCANDFLVFVTGGAGNYTQAANIFGFNNLYAGTCTNVPTTLFAYFLGPAVQNSTSGMVQNSPVLSLDGTKVAFVESLTNASIFHVLTMDKRGNSGCPNSSPCNGTAFNQPAVPCIVNGVMSCTTNNAVDTKMTMKGNVSVTLSTPFIDYSGNIAYVGDDTGHLHKFTGVFTGTLAEAGSPWPVTVDSGVILTAPVFDSGTSQNIFVGGSTGKLYCVTTAGVACSTPSIIVGNTQVLDPPVVDSTIERVFAEANSSTNAVLTETTTAFGAQINLTSEGPSGSDLYSPVFDNAYYTSGGTGNMYFCADTSGAATPELYQVPMTNGVVGAPKAVFQLVTTGNTGSAVDCSPLTEFFNSTQNIDYLFLSVKEHGFNTGTPNCQDNTCLMSFALPQTSPYTFPTSAKSTMAGGSLGPKGTSGVIVDNDSGTAGTSQIYFGNLQNNFATQVSQSGLQ